MAAILGPSRQAERLPILRASHLPTRTLEQQLASSAPSFGPSTEELTGFPSKVAPVSCWPAFPLPTQITAWLAALSESSCARPMADKPGPTKSAALTPIFRESRASVEKQQLRLDRKSVG